MCFVIVQELCESRGGRPGLSVLTRLLGTLSINSSSSYVFRHSSGAVWESRWTSWAVRPNETSGFRGRKELLNRASALVTTCPSYVNWHLRTLSINSSSSYVFRHSSGAVWESRWTSWAVRPNEPSGFRGRKALLNRASALVTTCP